MRDYKKKEIKEEIKIKLVCKSQLYFVLKRKGEKMKQLLKKENRFHVAIIILGAILLFLPAFHKNIWFDESYSVGLMNHSFTEIWTIGSHDVHPILYYWMLKIVNLIGGNNLIAYRIFSVIGIVLLGILGYSHIRKDFGKTTGILFTFFAMFLPVMLNYALEIRMYSWTVVLVTLMAIYLNRFIRQKDFKNLVLFGIFSLASCYMHYYALLAAGIMNLGLIIYVIRKRENFEKGIFLKFILVEAMQVILYLPWLICFVKQALRVGKGFWITIEFPQILIDILNFQVKGSLEEIIPTILASLFYLYIGYIIIKNIRKKEKIKEGIIPIAVYGMVIVIVALVSRISPILYARYLFTITGLLIFAISYFLAKENNQLVIGLICGAVLVLSIMNLKVNIEENYDVSNQEPVAYLQENLQPDDIIMYSNINNGGVIAALVDTNQQYFLNLENWTIEEAYKAYSPQMKVVYRIEDAVKEAKGRIFIIDTGDLSLYHNLENKEQYKEVCIQKFEPKYKNYTYQIVVLEK